MHQDRRAQMPRHAESEDLSLVEMAGTDNGSDSSHGNQQQQQQQRAHQRARNQGNSRVAATAGRRLPICLRNSPRKSPTSASATDTPITAPAASALANPSPPQLSSPRVNHAPVDTPATSPRPPGTPSNTPSPATSPSLTPHGYHSPDRALLLGCTPFEEHEPPCRVTGGAPPTSVTTPATAPATRRHTQHTHHVTMAPGTSGGDKTNSANSSGSDLDVKANPGKPPLNSRMSFSRRFSRSVIYIYHIVI